MANKIDKKAVHNKVLARKPKDKASKKKAGKQLAKKKVVKKKELAKKKDEKSVSTKSVKTESGLVLSIENLHLESCGSPPNLKVQSDENQYVSYFQNEDGEQAVFVMKKPASKSNVTARIFMGDAGWDKSYLMKGGEVKDLILSHSEYIWCQLAWMTALKYFGIEHKRGLDVVFPHLKPPSVWSMIFNS
eukprot:gnl/MRDRNA2_/MRDRNA2_134100_c0_seq1.p1 gnl/MRDRNA2_/MRDRNA2_134100_c0~~gnl/MRDRNA2_/MRDRNA2_134100_c0_seq1.p1  ORF type:complete len:189 (-),score=51.52 gnl/MRDRNA2_/MRDRNA2_134100_c0_seq1:89-655(-)